MMIHNKSQQIVKIFSIFLALSGIPGFGVICIVYLLYLIEMGNIYITSYKNEIKNNNSTVVTMDIKN